MFSTEFGTCLLGIARQTIAHALGCAAVGVDTSAAWLAQPAACFVTLTQYGQLRGCIGTLHAHRSLLDDLQSNVLAASRHDPRFEPVKGDDLESLRIEVSVLSRPEALPVQSEAALLASLRPHVDGLIVQDGVRRATFLPQVWEQLPDPLDFVSRVKQKAGLPATAWSSSMHWQRYSVQKWSEPPIPLC